MSDEFTPAHVAALNSGVVQTCRDMNEELRHPYTVGTLKACIMNALDDPGDAERILREALARAEVQTMWDDQLSRLRSYAASLSEDES